MHQGRVLAGKYRLLSKLTAGGMGSVWHAEHVELGSPAAVKLLEASIAESPEALARFKREAQSSASLRSTNIVQVFDFGVDGHTPYIAMELLRGQSLSDKLRVERTLSPQETASILSQVARAAAWAHSRGIVHRDLKPGNIFLSEDANDIVVKLLDFGIAKAVQMDLTVTPVTLAGAIMGTPQYMSPEQASGKRAVDHRTDIWSFAVIAFECLTGHHAFRADTLGGLVLAICTEALPKPSECGPVPKGFDEWFAHAAHRDPAERFNDIAQAGDALRSVCGVDSSVPSRSLRVTVGERAEMFPIATPITPRRHQDDSLVVDATAARTLANSMVVPHRHKVAIFLGLFATGAAITAMLHLLGIQHPQTPTNTLDSTAHSSSQQNDLPSLKAYAPDATHPVAAENSLHANIKAFNGSCQAVQSLPAAPTGKRRRSTPARQGSPIAPEGTAGLRPTPHRPTEPASASTSLLEAASGPSDALNCDPEVKKALGFCPRPGR